MSDPLGVGKWFWLMVCEGLRRDEMTEFVLRGQDCVWMDMNRFSPLVEEVMNWECLAEYQPSSLRESGPLSLREVVD